MATSENNLNIEFSKTNPRQRIREYSLHSYNSTEGEELFVNAIVDYIRITSDPSYDKSSIGSTAVPDSIATFNYNDGTAKVLSVTIPGSPGDQASATLTPPGTASTPGVDINTATIVDGTTTLTIEVFRTNPVYFTVIFDYTSGQDYIFNSSTGTISAYP